VNDTTKRVKDSDDDDEDKSDGNNDEPGTFVLSTLHYFQACQKLTLTEREFRATNIDSWLEKDSSKGANLTDLAREYKTWLPMFAAGTYKMSLTPPCFQKSGNDIEPLTTFLSEISIAFHQLINHMVRNISNVHV